MSEVKDLNYNIQKALNRSQEFEDKLDKLIKKYENNEKTSFQIDKQLRHTAMQLENLRKHIETLPDVLFVISFLKNYMLMQKFLNRGVGICQIRPIMESMENE